jgi:hypothetical protein
VVVSAIPGAADLAPPRARVRLWLAYEDAHVALEAGPDEEGFVVRLRVPA